MKNKNGLRIIKAIYLCGCLIVAFTPNHLNVEESKGGVTQVPFSQEMKELYTSDFDEMEKTELSKHEGLTSTIVSIDGEVCYEKYFNGRTEETISEIHSCTKTVIALLTGIAYDHQMISDEKSAYIDMFDGLEIKQQADGFEKIKLEDMLSMSSGINWDKYVSSWKVKSAIIENGLNYGLNLIPSAEILHEPGTFFHYDSNESRSVMALVAYNAGMEDCDFAQKYLFDKLEISDFLWPYNDSGLLPGGKDLFVSSRDLWKIGQLILNKGIYNGEQIVSEEWIEKMLTPIRVGVPAEDILPADEVDYSFYMWHIQYDGIDIHYAYGRGGQCVYLVPQYNICVVTTAIDKERDDNFRQIIFRVIDIYRKHNNL